MQYLKGSAKGWIEGDEYRKCVQKSVHFMRNNNSWGLDKAIIEDIKGKVKTIIIKDIPTGDKWKVSLDHFIAHSWLENWDNEQLFLPLQNWSYEKK